MAHGQEGLFGLEALKARGHGPVTVKPMEVCDPAVLLNAMLFECVAVGDAKGVAKFLATGAPVNSHNLVHGNGATPLIEATLRKAVTVMDVLLQAGADVNATDNMGRTSLHVACRLNDLGLAEKLLTAATADMNAQMNGTGIMPLHIAAANGNPELCTLLLNFGADVNGQNTNGETALHIAVGHNHEKVVDVLLGRGANADIRAGQLQQLPLHVSCFIGNESVTRKLIASGGHSLHVKDGAGRSAMEIARSYGHFKMSTALLQAESERRELAESQRLADIAAREAAELAAIKAHEEFEAQLRATLIARRKAEIQAKRDAAAAAKKAAEEEGVRRAIAEARARIVRVARESAARRKLAESRKQLAATH